jgi:hypothetical protein
MTDEPADDDLDPTDQEKWDAVHAREIAIAHQIIENLLPLFNRADREHGDCGDMAYALWIGLTRYLAENDWPPDRLAKDAGWHAADQTSEGRA